MDFIHFFGTTGDKSLMFSGCLQPGGIFLSLRGNRIVFDPGPGTFCGFVKTYPNSIQLIDAIVLSHVHFDHSNDINVMIEGMTNGGEVKRGSLITSSYCYSGEQRVILDYLKNYISKVFLVDVDENIVIKDIKVKVFKHLHGTPNYGFSFCYDSKKVSIITDTVYFCEICDYYRDSSVLVINVPYYCFPENKKPKHLCISDVKNILDSIKPQKAILTHFGKNIWESGIDKIALQLANETGIPIIAASSNTTYVLD